jgi:wyosine [tRNA(Phe)-imidazoG37] synthetase (radical SAM superfamily)
MNRTVAGPKFVVDSAYNAIMRSVRHVSFESLFSILKSFSSHKNADTVSRSLVVLSKSALSEDKEKSAEFYEYFMSNKLLLLSYFGEGLTCRKTEGKAQSRKVLVALSLHLGEKEFLKYSSEIESPMIRAVVHREVVKPSASQVTTHRPLALSKSATLGPLSKLASQRAVVAPTCIVSAKGRGGATVVASSSSDDMEENIFSFM